MANSSLVSYVWTGSKTNSNVRDHAIDTITIHHMAGNGTLAGCFNTLVSRSGSVNYAIDSNGKIGVMIDEVKRAWTSSNRPNDMRAVTMEVANDKPSDAGGWHISDKALASVINLCADICKRNGKTKMIWCGTLAATNARTFASNEMRMTIHKWFAATGCPGAYLESKMSYIAQEVTKKLSGATTKKPVDEIAKEVIAGKWGSGEERKSKLTAAGYDYAAVQKRVEELMGNSNSGNINASTGFRVETTAPLDMMNGTATAPPIYAHVEKGRQYTIEKTVVVSGQTFGKIKESAENASRNRWINLGYTKKV